MAKIHGKNAKITVDSVNVSAHTNSIEFEQTADDHDTTTFGNTGHTYQGGLTDGKISLKGLFDNDDTTGPRAAFQDNVGLVVAFEYQPEGTGTGKKQSTGNALITSYKESTPVADMITWEAELKISGAVTNDEDA